MFSIILSPPNKFKQFFAHLKLKKNRNKYKSLKNFNLCILYDFHYKNYIYKIQDKSKLFYLLPLNIYFKRHYYVLKNTDNQVKIVLGFIL